MLLFRSYFMCVCFFIGSQSEHRFRWKKASSLFIHDSSIQTLLLKTKLPRFIAQLMGIQRLQSPGVEQVIRNQFQAHIISWKSEKLRIMTRELTFARPRAYWVRCKGRWSSLSKVSMLWRVKYLLLAVVTVMSFSLISYLTWCKSSRKDFN